MRRQSLRVVAPGAFRLLAGFRGRSRKSDYAPPYQGDEWVMKFLIDECLSLDLVEVARGRGFVENSHASEA
jgi:hypothetical protein